ncbi:hypothetical protein PMAG_a3018 [Pseudoalteromonas mariniglutinosa NCIMB 1770]|nr:hypothetical protein [Pseudoalteromonas mariniglutinosa NCIMB 1770]
MSINCNLITILLHYNKHKSLVFYSFNLKQANKKLAKMEILLQFTCI